MASKRPWYMFYPLAGMLILSIVWCGYWFIAFSGAKELIQAERLEFAGQGMELICARETWGGFPFRFEFQCEIPSLHLVRGDEANQIQSTKILAVAQAYNPLHVILLVDGPTSIDQATVVHERALISVTVGLDKDWNASLEAAGVNAQDLFTAGQLKLFARKINGRLDLAADTKELTVIQPENSPITVSSAELVGRLAGQTLDISSLKISQGTVEFTATGTVSLDPQHRLAGRLSSQTNDIDGVMKFIEPIFALNEQDSATIKNLVTLTGSDPATNTTKADFTAKNGALYWGLIKLADLTPLY
ncbi:MAG TPA: DUF2125 domain-containing protein [Aestuariivirga sp.]|nr:DUF2125 domain-containing protein [Aestuariivirga sp.]